MIIYVSACIVAVIIIVMAGIQNWKIHPKKIDNSQNAKISAADSSTENSNLKAEEENKKIEEENKKKEEENRKAEEEKKKQEKDKALEDKYMQGYNAFHDKKCSEAISIEDEVLKEDSSFYKAYNVKGIALCYSGKYDEGMKNIDKALELKPDYGYAVFNKALAYELFAHYDEAIKWYEKDMQLEKYIWTYYGIASIYGRRGDVDNTIKYLKEAVAIDSGVKSLAAEEQDFNPVKDSKEFQALIKN